MPYKKTYTKKSGGAPLNKTQKKEVKRMVKTPIEVKTNDVVVTSIGVPTTGIVISVQSLMANGTASQGGVIGSKVRPTKLEFRYNWVYQDATNMLRLIVIQMKASPTIPTGAFVLESVGNVRTPLSDFEVDNNNQFKVLYDKLMYVDNIDNVMRIGHVTIPGKKFRNITWTNGLTALESGGIYIICYSDSLLPSDPSIQLYSRLSYQDA